MPCPVRAGPEEEAGGEQGYVRPAGEEALEMAQQPRQRQWLMVEEKVLTSNLPPGATSAPGNLCPPPAGETDN